MKNLRTPFVCVSMLLFSLCSFAQSQTIPINEPDRNKPHLFDSYPDQIPVNLTNINGLLGARVGNDVAVSVSSDDSFRFEGKVVSAASKFQNSVVSVVVRSTNFAGTRFNISKITNADGTVSYRGFISGMQYGDLYELKSVNGSYMLIKRKYYDLVNE